MKKRIRLEMTMFLPRVNGTRPSGFTLPEILVAVAMVGVLSAVVLPTVIGQVSKGEVSRVVQDLKAIEQATQMFRNDVGKWPSTLQHTVTPITDSGTGAAGGLNGDYPSNASTLWRGPYLARGDASSGLETSGGTIQNQLLNWEWDADDAANSPNFVTVRINGLPATRMGAIDLAVDGEAGNDIDNPADGKIRYASNADPNLNILYYLTSPLK